MDGRFYIDDLFAGKLILYELNKERTNLTGHELVALGIWVDAVAEHPRRIASLRRAVRDENWGLGRVQPGGPGRDCCIDGIDRGVVHRQRNDLVDL